MPGRDNDGNQSEYRYKYQGQEKDAETGMEAFELRLWDARIGRWLTTDPAGQYSSPYLGMGNNPVILRDSDGGYAEKNPVYGSDGVYRGNTVEGFTGQPIIYDCDLDFSEMTAGGLVDFNGGTFYDNASLSNSIMDKIERHIFSRLEGQNIFDETFTMSSFEFRVRTGTANEGNGAYSWSRGTKYINRDKGYSNGMTTVENLWSAVIDHEWYSHLMKKQGSLFGSHRLAYQNQVKSPRWAGTTGEFKRYIVNALHKFHGMESDGLLRGIYLKEYLKWHDYSAPIMLDEVIIGGN
ncbi:RHS repeat-associated core domain-containing protein [Zunongwangia pacifica]|uniref:RHS repeat-associated core domain-containing protein n=1 Tax=Zunongwangia pacifica TaxID=2911062 RepID=A0A9X1ZT10_9FLAO|nr:RHS repeat-associated core domain-containing protein [Zunongwangia pacifica]MCL6219429.1 hypothetical protein [Zunongwangia pacifica]